MVKRKYSGSNLSGKRFAYATPPRSSPNGPIRHVARRGRPFLGAVGRNLFGAAATTALSAHPYGRAALGAYRAARFVGGVRKALKARKPAGFKSTGGPNARFAGKFKKGRKVARDPYASKGFRHTVEIHGTVSDPDCVYVGHSTFSGIQTLELLSQVLLRKLFAKAGVQIRDIHEPIRGYQANTSSMWRIVITRVNKEDGTVDTSVQHTTPAGADESIYLMVGDQQAGVVGSFTGLYNVLYDAALGGNGADVRNVRIPTSIALYQEEENITQFFQFRAELKLDNEHVNIMTKSELKIQNRSVSASGGTTTESVDANPLMGKLYHFNGGAPRARVPYVNFIESVPDMSGVITTRAAQLTATGAQYMSEPPGGKAFWNCKSIAKIGLQPGQIRYDSISFKRKMQIHKFLKAMNLGSGPSQRQINLFGKSALIALEDVINVNASQNIVCSYEVNREYGLFLTTSSQTFCLGHKYSATQNNLTA